jgi:hypothetical protein
MITCNKIFVAERTKNQEKKLLAVDRITLFFWFFGIFVALHWISHQFNFKPTRSKLKQIKIQ